MKTLLLLILFLLQGCATVLDQSHFKDLEVKEGIQSPKPVLTFWLAKSDYQKINTLCHKTDGKSEGYKLACATFDVDFDICDKDSSVSFCKYRELGVDLCVMITHTQTTYNILGHEVRHCFHKHFH
jgi:hypothetical protein